MNILKEKVISLDTAPTPQPGYILEIRSGKIKTLGDEPSGIFKVPREGLVEISRTGVVGDEHVYHTHGGTERAVNMYASSHYADWQNEKPDKAHLFQTGGFGENLVGTNLNEENVCVGDVFRVGADVLLEVSEPRNPCYKLNIRFEWSDALKRIQRTGRVGWNHRVLQTGQIRVGDKITLVKRPNPRWSLLNVQKVVHAKFVEPALIEELSEMGVVTDFFRDLAFKRLESAPRMYTLASARDVASRVKQFTFELKEPTTIKKPHLRPHSFVQIRFGPNLGLVRSYSVVSGDLHKFSLGVALDDLSRGGSEYLHRNLKVGDEIEMSAGFDPEVSEHEQQCKDKEDVTRHLVIIGGIGVTAFLPALQQWRADGVPLEVHYAVRSLEDAAYQTALPGGKTTIYAKSENERLNIDQLIPPPDSNGRFHVRIFCCGPQRLMDACKQRTEVLGYPTHMVHFESFGKAAGGEYGEPFEAQVYDNDRKIESTVEVPSDKSLLQVLRDAGFEVMSSCESGKCGMCKVDLCGGQVEHRGTALLKTEKARTMLSCVDRGIGRIAIEVD